MAHFWTFDLVSDAADSPCQGEGRCTRRHGLQAVGLTPRNPRERQANRAFQLQSPRTIDLPPSRRRRGENVARPVTGGLQQRDRSRARPVPAEPSALARTPSTGGPNIGTSAHGQRALDRWRWRREDRGSQRPLAGLLMGRRVAGKRAVSTREGGKGCPWLVWKTRWPSSLAPLEVRVVRTRCAWPRRGKHHRRGLLRWGRRLSVDDLSDGDRRGPGGDGAASGGHWSRHRGPGG